MPGMPDVGTRVSLRYRLPAGEVPPLTDVVGRLLQTEPTVLVQTKSDGVVAVAPADVVAVRELPEIPVRTGEIRNLEHAAALGWPGTEHRWLDGWFVRRGGTTRRANSAVPLRFTSHREIVEVARWYADRGVPALISAPDRLFRVPAGVPTDAENLVMATDLERTTHDIELEVLPRPSDRWLHLYQRDVPVDVLTAVVDGEVGFGCLSGAAVGRVAITEAPDGTRWAGVSAVRVAESARRQGLARRLCAGLLDWAAQRGATRGYVQVVVENTAARSLYESMGFVVHHRSRYVAADALL